jgi:SAM-dependent methyltransferase
MAQYYDLLYKKKNYSAEVDFLKAIIKEREKVLDVGCGTGRHLKLLEENGCKCDGLDINEEMVNITKKTIKGNAYVADVLDFNLNKKYDAIISMFAVVNHLKDTSELKIALINLKKHLNPGGVMILDLHNPQSSGRKEDLAGDIKRIMAWDFDVDNKIEYSTITYELGDGRQIKTEHVFTIFDVEEIKYICQEVGLEFVNAFANYKFDLATKQSKNIQVVLKG